MHLSFASIKQFRSIEALDWQPPQETLSGWHIVLGDNSSGKTSFLRALALCLLGPTEAGKAFPNPYWITLGHDQANIKVRVTGDPGFDQAPALLASKDAVAVIQIRNIRGSIEISAGTGRSHVGDTVWTTNPGDGWFSVGFGALRRLQGSSATLERLLEESGHLTNHMSLLFEDVALVSLEQWVVTLIEEGDKELSFVRFREWFNGLTIFPEKTVIQERRGRDLMVSVGGGGPIRLRDLSDGFQSVTVILFEIVRRLAEAFSIAQIFGNDGKIQASGVALVDEIDAHLHPNWQHTIGTSLCEAFPNFQWVVSTHSPFVAHCQYTRSVLAMEPNEAGKREMVTGDQFNRLVLGDIDDAFATSAFGVDRVRSDESDQLLRHLARLNWLEIQRPLSEEEAAERNKLRARLPDQPHVLPQLLEEAEG